MTPAEWSRPVRVDTLGEGPRSMSIAAEEDERNALARRFGLVTIGALSAEAELVRKGEEIRAKGRFAAEVTQSCVATGEPIVVQLDEPFAVIFRPQPEGEASEEEVELNEADMDVTFYDGAAIDLGEAVAETLSLSLDPYPRVADAEQRLKAAGVKSEGEAGPFGALAALRDQLDKK